MSHSNTITGNEARGVIEEAVRRRTPVTLSHRASDGWQTIKSQLVEPARATGRIHVESPADAADALEVGTLLGVSFRRGHKKCMFAGKVEARTSVRCDGRDVSTLALSNPDVIQLLQRRVYHRTPVPDSKRIEVSIHPPAPGSNGGGSGRDYRGLLRNVSVGGMAVAVPRDANTSLSSGQTLIATIHLPGGAPLETDVNYRHQAIVGDELQLGFQFVGLETTAAGREVLARLSQFSLQLQRTFR
jgi:c-di-GMP-binding flagellar brake protein YcgR